MSIEIQVSRSDPWRVSYGSLSRNCRIAFRAMASTPVCNNGFMVRGWYTLLFRFSGCSTCLRVFMMVSVLPSGEKLLRYEVKNLWKVSPPTDLHFESSHRPTFRVFPLCQLLTWRHLWHTGKTWNKFIRRLEMGSRLGVKSSKVPSGKEYCIAVVRVGFKMIRVGKCKRNYGPVTGA